MVGLGGLEPPTSPLSGLRDWKIMQNRTRFGVALLRRIRLPSQAGATGLNLSCRRARFAFVSLRPVVLNLGV